MEFVKKVDGNVIYADFPLHRAVVAMRDDTPVVPIHHNARIIALPVAPLEEDELFEDPLPDELITITNFLRDNYPDDYGEIGTYVSYACSDDTPGHIILQEVLAALESRKPLLFRRVSKLLT